MDGMEGKSDQLDEEDLIDVQPAIATSDARENSLLHSHDCSRYCMTGAGSGAGAAIHHRHNLPTYHPAGLRQHHITYHIVIRTLTH